MKKQRIFFLMVSIMISMTLACAIGYEGLQISDDPEPMDPISQMIAQQTFEANMAEDSEQESNGPASGEIQATQVPVISGSTNAEAQLSNDNEYSVSGTNFGCTCSVDGNTLKLSLEIDGDQLTYAGKVYDKIADKTYKRSYMGYYILQSGEGENMTTTQVDEERHDIIILTDNGFISEHYQGDEGSPCCYHTFTLEK